MIGLNESLRIGGELEFSAEDYLGRPLNGSAARPIEVSCLWTDLGRSALLIAAMAIRRLGGRARVWLPALSCASIAPPFEQSGFEVRYYSVGAGLMGGKISPPPVEGGDALLLIHYLGHRNEEMLKLAGQIRASGVWIIEDCAQASMTPRLGEHSDFAVTSYRKFLPVVDGATLLSRLPVDLAAVGLGLRPPNESFVSARLVAKILRGVHADSDEFLPLIARTEQSLEAQITPRHMSWLSTWIMERLDLSSVAARRRANWLGLSHCLAREGLSDKIQTVFKTLAEDTVPLGLLIRVGNGRRDELRRFLVEKHIYCPIHWPLTHVPRDSAFRQDRELEQSLLTLPVDQRMSAAHMDYLAAQLTTFFAM